MRIALKVDVDTLRGTREGVPRLLHELNRRGLHATFLFSLGPDHTGRAIRRAFRRGFAAKVRRTSVLSHYGPLTLLYGTLLPGPDIGRLCADLMRAAHHTGHEVGIHAWDHVEWQDHVRHRDSAWAEHQMHLAYQRFQEIFHIPPTTHGAAGWQMHHHAFHQLDVWEMPYASDTRGLTPFRPLVAGQALNCVQLPTTLPTLDELLGVSGMNAEAAAQSILSRTRRLNRDEVFTLHAELEGGKLLPAFETLLDGWLAQGYHIGSLGEFYRAIHLPDVPVCEVYWEEVQGRSGELMVQGPPIA